MTDTDEKIEKALWGLTRVYDAPHGHGTEVGVHAPVHEVVAAVLPIIAAEVQAAKAEALREAAEDLNPYPTIGYTIPQVLRDRATEYETGDRA